MPLTVIVRDFPCRICQEDTPHVYQDKEEQLVCMKCRAEGRETVVKLDKPNVAIGFIWN